MIAPRFAGASRLCSVPDAMGIVLERVRAVGELRDGCNNRTGGAIEGKLGQRDEVREEQGRGEERG